MIPQEEEKITADQMQLMKTQDIKYIEMKHRIEAKVIDEPLQSGPPEMRGHP